MGAATCVFQKHARSPEAPVEHLSLSLVLLHALPAPPSADGLEGVEGGDGLLSSRVEPLALALTLALALALALALTR